MLTDGTMEVLVQWKELLEFENTWEDLEIIKDQFLDFDLKDKVNLEEVGNDRPLSLMYQRKARKSSSRPVSQGLQATLLYQRKARTRNLGKG